jgi:outer membrane lipoprotein SlyB
METDMEITTTRSIHPLTALAAVSVTVFSLAGVGAITGLIPTSHGQSQAQAVAAVEPAKPAENAAAANSTVPAESQPARKIATHKAAPKPYKPVEVAAQPAEEPVKAVKHEAPAQAAAKPVEEPVKMAKYEPPVELAQNAPASRAEAQRPSCYDCGVIESVRELEKAGNASGIGAVGGGLLGGLLGHQTGGGRGNTVMTVLGAVGGTIAGNAVEKKVKTVKNYEITVRFDDGTSQKVTQDTQPSWHSGDKVKLVNGVITSNG